MFRVSGYRDASDLDRDALWRALVDKAHDAVPFVPAITECRVLERRPGGFDREIVLRGERLRERVTFFPKRAVRFVRLSGRARGTIWNRIESGSGGRQRLRFTFELELAGLEPGGAAEQAYARMMRGSYLHAVETTLARAKSHYARTGRAPR